MNVVILCGGKGTRLREETDRLPKPMIPIGGQPVLWHIMNTYSQQGFNDFILCLGYKGDVIREYFYNYGRHNSDFTVDLNTGDVLFHNHGNNPDWRVTLVETGLNTMTGSRVKRVERYVESQDFFLTYGDGLTDLDIGRTLTFHKTHKKIGTVVGVSPPSQYGVLHISGDRVLSFSEKPAKMSNKINGGYFVFSQRIFNYLQGEGQCILEKEPLESLACDNELMVYHHDGFWQCMDTFRDYNFLSEMWESGNPPWVISP